ncbi:MAG: 5'-deoxynucleotidase [Angelakisella sp.]
MSYSFFALLSRMKHILRWGLMRNSVSENLSEHTLDVAYITHVLTVLYNQNHPDSPLDSGKAVLYALYHDCSEILTGDMPTPVKYRDLRLKAAYKAVEQEAQEQLLSRLPTALLPHFSPCFSPEGSYKVLVKAADKLSALIKCTEERKMGNSEFSTAYTSTLLSLQEMNLPEVDIFLESFLPAYSLTLDEL